MSSPSAAKKFVPLVLSKEHRSLKKSIKNATPAPPIHKSERKKKERLLSTLSTSSEAEKRSAMESGRVKFVGQELRISGMRKLRASKCIVIGDNNTVIGDDNVLVGVNNKAIGEGNRLTDAQREPPSVSQALSSSIVAAVEARESVAAVAAEPPSQPVVVPEVAGASAGAVAAAAAADTAYCSTEYWTLPENWIVVNGVVIWRPEDITIVLREYIAMARAKNWNMQCQPRSITFEASLLLSRSPAFLGLFSKYDIPYQANGSAGELATVAATASGRIPMPLGMHQCRVRPTVGKLTIPLVDPDAPQSPAAAAAAVAAVGTAVAPTPARQPRRSTHAAAAVPPQAQAQSVPAESFMPKPGDKPDANAWLVSALDLPGTACKAGKDEPVCRVCMDNRCDVLFEPCHHLIVCRECAIELQKESMARPNGKSICPTCRVPIKYYSIVFAGS